MTADELCGGVDDNVGTMFDRTDEERRAESIVDDEDDIMAVGDLGDGVKISDIGIGVSEGLGVDDLCLGEDGSFEGSEVVDVDDCILNALSGKSVGDEIVGTAIKVVGRYDMVAWEKDVLEGVSDCRGTRGDSQTCHTTFESRYAVFKNALSGVGETAVDVTRVTESEAVGGVLGIAEDVGRGLVDWHCTCVGCGIGILLTNMNLKGLEVKFALCHSIDSFFLFLVYEICLFCRREIHFSHLDIAKMRTSLILS